jgi:tetratricopeptide (TPR) repeat protein
MPVPEVQEEALGAYNNTAVRTEGGISVEPQFKTISKNGIPEALSKVQHYRYLNQAEEAESICRDILTIDAENQAALRLLGLAITDQFTGALSDRHHEAAECFEKLTSPYECLYYSGILHERRAKALMRAGHMPHSLLASFENAMHCYEEAEKIRPKGNDDALLRWNRCLRLVQSMPALSRELEQAFEAGDSPPV